MQSLLYWIVRIFLILACIGVIVLFIYSATMQR